MQIVEHCCRVCFEGLRKEIVQVHLIRLVNPGKGYGAAVARRTGTSCSAGHLVSTVLLNGRASNCNALLLLIVLPILKGRMIYGEVGHPLGRT